MTVAIDEGVPAPATFTADTRTRYVMPLVKPLMRYGDVADVDTVDHVTPPSLDDSIS